MKIIIIVLSKNEESTITDVITNLKEQTLKYTNDNFDIILCDDSNDKTPSIANKCGVRVLKGSGHSLGYSYYHAINYALTEDVDIIMSLDGDGQVDTKEFSMFFDLVRNGDFDMVVGSRFQNEDLITYKYPLINFIGVKILAFLISISCRQKFSDSHGGFRVMRKETAESFLNFLGTHSYVQETIINAKRKGSRIKEIPSLWKARHFGESRVVHSVAKYAYRMGTPLLLQTRINRPLLLISIATLAIEINILNISVMLISLICEVLPISLRQRNLRQLNQFKPFDFYE